MHVHLSTERHRHIVAHVDAFAGLEVGHTLAMHFDPQRLHFFESDGEGRAIDGSRPPVAERSG
jgi:hypothetical protein